jgi:hypothetical protein
MGSTLALEQREAKDRVEVEDGVRYHTADNEDAGVTITDFKARIRINNLFNLWLPK